MDSVREQVDQLEQRYRDLVEDVQKQLKDLESRSSDLVDKMQDQLPDSSELSKRARDVNTDIRDRVGLLAGHARDAASDAIDAITEAGNRLLRRDDDGDAKGGGAKKLDANATKADLYAEATRLGIVGRSSMSKAELASAIKKAG